MVVCREQVKPTLVVVYPQGTSAVDHATNTVLAYVFGKRMDIVFQDLKALLAPFNISRYFTDDWGLTDATWKLAGMRWASATPKRQNAKT